MADRGKNMKPPLCETFYKAMSILRLFVIKNQYNLYLNNTDFIA